MEVSSYKPQCPISRPQNLSNFESKKQVTDILHIKTEEPGVCTRNVCNGSLMNIRRMPLETRKSSEVLSQAKQFLEEFYKNTKRFEGKEHLMRLQEVTRSVTRTGTYELTYDELLFGAKMAWRNAPRCIGRISWNTLHLIDGRHVKTAKEMFELMLQHLDYATNKGNIRSTITVFPQRRVGQRDFRVWNQQLISYAGYQQPDGSVVGDPAFVEFTQICEKLGWKGKGGRFDVLPWVVSTPTGEPEWFSIPKEKVLTVPIVHPEYDWFKDLGIEWFAIPAVSGMMFDCGGLQFTAAPFSGWYMASEIGTRDLCDAQRYNMLQVFGEKLGLDTRTPTTLWKDKTTLEVNIAVLHSFKKKEITLVDHHTAAETFMQFHSNEYRQRGGCPADWAWIVPPISGSLTPVFHQEMSLYYLKPGYEYQIPAWVSFERENKMLSAGKNSEEDTPILKFRKAAFAVVFASTLYSGALSRRVRIAIIYGTETGKAQTYANSLAEIFSRSFNPQVISMEDYDISKLSSETLVALIASTTGVGIPPQSAQEFVKSLYELKETNHADEASDKSLTFWDDYNAFKINGGSTITDNAIAEEKILLNKNRGFFSRLVNKLRRGRRYDMEHSFTNGNSGNLSVSTPNLYKNFGKSTNSLFRTLDPASDISFAVFALGSTNYKYFCAFGKYLDNVMFDLGGDRILELSLGDETENQQETFNGWSADLLKVCSDRFHVEHIASQTISTDQITNGKQVRISPHPDHHPQSLAKGLSQIHGKNIVTCEVIANKTLYEDQDKWYQQIVLNTGNDSSLRYEPGDHVGVLPSNSPNQVYGVLVRLGNCPDPDKPIQVLLRQQTDKRESWIQHPQLPVASVRTLLSRYLDINSPPSQALLQLLADAATNNKQASRLSLLATNREVYLDWKKWNSFSLLEVFKEFSSVRIDAGLLVCRLPILQPRFYSISSSPLAHPDQLALTIAKFSYRTQGGKGALHNGVCTSFLKGLKSRDTLELFHRSVPEFHLPTDGSSAPILLLGAGSGVAPLRGFWQHYHHEIKSHQKGSKRDMTLYYGCQSRAADLYAEEKAAMCRAKVLTHAHLALSREPRISKSYIQDLLLVNGPEVYKQLVQKGGHVYICGSAGMADGINKSLLSIIKDHGRTTIDQAQNILQKMKDEHRFHEDIFGSGSPY